MVTVVGLPSPRLKLHNRMLFGLEELILGKKIRGQRWRQSRHPQPRLPGSVVGEASMRLGGKNAKITKDNDL